VFPERWRQQPITAFFLPRQPACIIGRGFHLYYGHAPGHRRVLFSLQQGADAATPDMLRAYLARLQTEANGGSVVRLAQQLAGDRSAR
jgi:hypothetical protein